MSTPEGRDGGGTIASPDSEMTQFLSNTQRRAFGLAFRITADTRLAEEATAAAYRSLKPPFGEAALFEGVRAESLKRAAQRSGGGASSYQLTAAVRAAFESLEQLQRSSLELAHTAGMSVQSIATVLGEDPAAVRTALRQALLHLGAIVRADGGSR